MKKTKHIDMLNGPIVKDLIRSSIPLFFQGVLSLLFGTADVVIIGKLSGDASVAAVGATSSLTSLLTNIFYGVSIGTNVLIAKYIGAQDYQEVDDTIHTSVAFSFVGGIALIFIGFFLSKPLLVLMGTPVDVLEAATRYMQVYFLSMPGIMIYDYGAAILRSFGDTKRPVYFLFVGGVLNVVFNILFVAVFHLDVIGVALGTVVSQTVSGALMMLSLTRDIGTFKVERKKIKIHKKSLIELLKFGIPTGLQSSMFSLSNVVIQSTVNSFGSMAIAGNTAASNIEGYVATPSNAIYSACMSFIAMNLGAKKFDRIKSIVRYSLVIAVIAGGIFGFGAYLFGVPLLKLYISESEAIAAGMLRMAKYSAYYFICAIMDVMTGVVRGMGFSFIPMCISLTGACGLRILWIITLVRKFNSQELLYACYPVTWALVALSQYIFYRIEMKKLERE